jgi:hypothetical protein
MHTLQGQIQNSNWFRESKLVTFIQNTTHMDIRTFDSTSLLEFSELKNIQN